MVYVLAAGPPDYTLKTTSSYVCMHLNNTGMLVIQLIAQLTSTRKIIIRLTSESK